MLLLILTYIKHIMRGMGVHDVVVHDVGMNDMGLHDVAMHDMGVPGMGMPGVDVHKMGTYFSSKN
jgi:hypothetical protein